MKYPFSSVPQIYSSGAPGAGASEDQRTTSILHGARLPGVADGQSKRWGLGENKVRRKFLVFKQTRLNIKLFTVKSLSFQQ